MEFEGNQPDQLVESHPQPPTDAPIPEAQNRESLVSLVELDATDVCRLPNRDGPVWERAFHDANARSVERAEVELEAWLPDLDELLSLEWTGPAHVLRGGCSILDGSSLPDLFDSVLAEHHVPADRILAFDGRSALARGALGDENLSFGVERPVTANLAAVVAKGGGVYLHAVDHHDATLTRRLGVLDRVMQVRCSLDLALAGTEGAGVLVTGDRQARLVGPVDERVVVEIRDAVAVGDGIPPLPSTHPLEPGEWLLVPPGWGLRIAGETTPVLVAVLVVPVLPLQNLIGLLLDEAQRWPRLRGYVPFDRRLPHEAYQGSIYAEGLEQSVLDLAANGAFDRLLARHLGFLPARWSASLLDSLRWFPPNDEITTVRCPLPGGIVLSVPQPEYAAGLVGGGRRIDVSLEVAASIAVIFDGAPHRPEDLGSADADELGRGRARALCLDLIRTGFLEVV